MGKFERSFTKGFQSSYGQGVQMGRESYGRRQRDKQAKRAKAETEAAQKEEQRIAEERAKRTGDIFTAYNRYRLDPTNNQFNPAYLSELDSDGRSQFVQMRTYWDNYDKRKEEAVNQQFYDAYINAQTPDEKRNIFTQAPREAQLRIKGANVGSKVVNTRKILDREGNPITVVTKEDDFGTSWTEEYSGDDTELSTADAMSMGHNVTGFFNKYKGDLVQITKNLQNAELMENEFSRRVEEIMLAEGATREQAELDVESLTGLKSKARDAISTANAYKKVVTRNIIDNSSPDIKAITTGERGINFGNPQEAKIILTELAERELDEKQDNDSALNYMEFYTLGYLYYLNTGEPLDIIDQVYQRKLADER